MYQSHGNPGRSGTGLFFGKHTDFNVLECGKGAKYDDVNNVRHDYAVINRIFLEHTRELGDTLTAIAEDKSHVITGEQKCVYFAEQEPEVLEILQRRAETLHIPYKIYGRDFHAENIRYTCFGMQFDVEIGDNIYADLQIPLLGEHQAKNCALALAVCVDVLSDLRRESAVFSLPDIRKNLSLLHWPGRMEVLRSKPFVLLDACINATSCENVKEVLRHLGGWNCTVIVGIPEDKDYAGVVRSMKGMANRIILTRSGNPHYHFPKTAGDIGRRRYWHNMDRFRETGTDSGRFLSGSHCNLGNDFGNFRSRADFSAILTCPHRIQVLQ